MSLNFRQTALPSCLCKKNKRKQRLLDGKPRTVQRRFQEVAFIFSPLSILISICLQRRRSFLRLHTPLRFALLCFASLAQVARQASAYFMTSRCHCCTEGISFFFSFLFLSCSGLDANVQIIILSVCVKKKKNQNGTKPQASRYCRAVDLEIWVRAFVPVCLDELRILPQQL